jgi:para-nitrobenzyl esterase
MAGSGEPSGAAVVATGHGRVRGAELDGLLAWRGIPYARPPSGELRFRPPRPPAAWDGVRDCIRPAPVAWQSEGVNPFTGQPVILDRSEDCLYVNVTAPSGPPVAPAGYPVLVWVHGGGYVQGSGAGELIGDGAGLARLGLIVVTFNYRLGSLGFLDLGEEVPDSGRAGFLDQVAALRWVQANIAAFGGDPGRVTVYGVSAGAKSVANLLASPLTAGLISRAISSSGGGEHVASPDQAARVRRRLVKELGLDPASGQIVARLLGVPPPDLVAAQEAIAAGPAGTWVWRPSLGGAGIPVLPVEAIAAGAAAGISLLIGSNGNEGATYQLMDPTAAGQAAGVLTELFGADEAAAMLAAYPVARPELDGTGIRVAVLSAERYGVPTLRLARAQAAHAPVWRYRYDGCPPGLPAALAGGHGLDMLAVWGADGFREVAAGGDAQAQTCLAMAATWAGFSQGESLAEMPGGAGSDGAASRGAASRGAGSGSAGPGGSGPDGEPAASRLAWGQFDPADELTLVIDEEPHAERHPRQAEVDIWAGRTWASGTWWPLGV